MTSSAGRLLNVRRLWVEPAALDTERGQQVRDRFPEAEVIEVASHWNIPELHGNAGNLDRWVRVKTEDLVVGTKKSIATRVNGRSADFIAPSTSNGCAMACVYCYVPRRKGYANPITVFTNIEQIIAHLRRHVGKQGAKPEPNQCDPQAWVYDLGENSDCSVDALVSDNVTDLIHAFRGMTTAKASFATKYVNRDLLDADPQGRTRIRFSLMPHADARQLDVRTTPIADRIAAIDDFVAAGYEVHLNFSPVVLRGGWIQDWTELLRRLDDELGAAFKAQSACEVIMLTHNEGLHQVNLGWHPQAERVLWRPDLQEAKVSENGQHNVRYDRANKARAVRTLTDLIARHTHGYPSATHSDELTPSPFRDTVPGLRRQHACRPGVEVARFAVVMKRSCTTAEPPDRPPAWLSQKRDRIPRGMGIDARIESRCSRVPVRIILAINHLERNEQ